MTTGATTAAARPRSLIVVTGTATEIGKTWATARVCAELRAAGCSVAARKPAQSFEPGDVEAAVTDAHVLAAASGAPAETVCPEHRWYPVPMAPPMAADALGRPSFGIDDLVAELRWPDPAVDVGLLETAGGVRSPLAADGDTLSVVARVAPDHVLLVADAGLGTINSVRLCLDALHGSIDLRRVAVLLNRFDAADDLHVRNAAWLTAEVAGPVVTDVRALSSTFVP